MFKNLRLLWYYIRILNKNKALLLKEHGLRVDWVWRLYKIYTVNEYDKKSLESYGPEYIDTLIKIEILKIDETMINIGMSELMGLSDIQPFGNFDYGLVFRFKFIDTSKFFQKIIWTLLFILTILISVLFTTFTSSIIIGAVTTLLFYIIKKLIIN